MPTWQIQAILLAKDDRGLRIASVRYVPGKTHPTVRIVLQPARTIPVTVVDGKGEPIAAAKVGVAFALRNGRVVHDGATEDMTREQTDAKGQARLHLPADVPLRCVWAAKAAAGFDYVLYREPVVERQLTKKLPPDPSKRVPEDSRPIQFVFGGVHRLRVHVVNERHRPLPGFRIRARLFEAAQQRRAE